MEALKVSRQMDNWNDDRLDELVRGVKNGFEKVDERFEKVDARFEKVEGEIKKGFAAVDERFEKADQTSSAMGERVARIETKLEGLPRLERVVWGFGSALLIAVLGPRFF